MISAITDTVLPVIMADTDALLPAANPVLDSARGSEQAKHQREVAVAELVLGDDLDILGGTAPIANFQQLASTDTCGKMAALQKLLALWHENGGNKVRLKGRGCPWGSASCPAVSRMWMRLLSALSSHLDW